MNELEVLYVAERRLKDPNVAFDFCEWTSCTCGHLYTASTGREPNGATDVNAPGNPSYVAAITAAARALGWVPMTGSVYDENNDNAAHYVSNYTAGLARLKPELADLDEHRLFRLVERADALRAVRDAIAVIEAEQEAARQAIIGAHDDRELSA